jgi:nucleotide-binding universal stress UspA family protein
MSTGKVTASGDVANRVAQFQRILVATDFSTGARATLDYALGVATRYHSKVFLVHVVPVLQYVSPESSEQAIQQARKFAAQEMARLVDAAGSSGIVHTEILSAGRVWPLLQGYIEEREIDLLVMGTHGRSPARNQLLGPVSEEIFRLAGCPILTVGTLAEKPALASSGVHRILYATNFKPHSERTAAFAHSLEHEHGANLTVLHVVEDQPHARESSHGIIRDFMLRRMRRGLPKACVGNCEPEFQVRFGEPGEQILSLAREQQSDLIILGLRGGTNTEGQLPSAIAYKVVCQSSCPVLTTRL